LFKASVRPKLIGNTFIHSKNPENITRQHAVQLTGCTFGEIKDNTFIEPIGKSRMEDTISIHKSNGTENEEIRVSNNILVGGGPAKSGGGIMLGDGGGDYQIAENNVCSDVGQYGIAISGGSHFELRKNFVFSPSYSWTNVGMYVGKPDKKIRDVSIIGNRVNWKNKENKYNPFYVYPDVSIFSEGNQFKK
jgi:hypothetical protein